MGKDLIGMSEAELIAHIGREPDGIGDSVEYDNGLIQNPVDCYDLAIQVWFEGGLLICAKVSGAEKRFWQSLFRFRIRFEYSRLSIIIIHCFV
ncbi:hypothetical protein [Roseibium sp. LAB1]